MNENLVTLARGFAEPVHDAGSVFRAILDATAQPGRPVALGTRFAGLDDLAADIPRPLAAALLALADFETPVWIDRDERRELEALVRFHCGARLATCPAEASFAVIRQAERIPDLDAFAWGTPEYPDRSATLLVVVDSLDGGTPMTLTGPGIETHRRFAPAGLPARFWQERRLMQADFPCGLDCLFFDATLVLALPRTSLAQPLEH
jgi:alpha-D-ribose 1-methylphosphonate 5-triphosphate synthase subunit PhnH